jgi:hypothetical protein
MTTTSTNTRHSVHASVADMKLLQRVSSSLSDIVTISNNQHYCKG